MRPALLLLFMLLAVAHAGVAAASDALVAGMRVRLTAPELGPQRQVGTIVEVHSDTLLFTADHQTASTPVRTGSLTGLDVSQGKRSHALAGVGIGLLVGAAGGLAIASSGNTTNNEESGIVTLIGTLAGGGVGLIAGAVAGSNIRTERWEPLRLPISIGFLPKAHALALTVTYW